MADGVLEQFLHERDVSCPVCEHTLRNVASGQCPACGHELRLCISLPEHYLEAWVALVVILAIGAGMGMWILFATISYSIEGGFESIVHEAHDMGFAGGAALVALVGLIPIVPFVLTVRNRFVRVARPAQWAMVGCIGVYVLLSCCLYVGWLV